MNDRSDDSSRRPRFCPRCRKSARFETDLCADCGETLRPKGYCEICEDWLSSEGGADCPKHDVPLVEGPAALNVLSTATRMVTVATFGLTAEAHAPRIRLQAEGIPVFLDGERMGMNGIYQVATGGVKLQVPEEHAADARILLAQNWSPVEDDDQLEDPWAGLDAPHPSERRRSLMKGAILFHLIWPAGAAALLFFYYLMNRLLA